MKMQILAREAECFVIIPIGKEGTDTRKRTDTVIKHLINPAIEDLYVSKVPHEISESGVITTQLIHHIVTAPLLIADLTDHNPNVYYELAIRHAVGLPAILIIEKSQENEIPFDLRPLRRVLYDLTNLDTVDESKRNLRLQVEEITDYKAAYGDIVSDTVTLMQIPEEHKNKVFLGTLIIASMVRFDLIEPYFKPFEETEQTKFDNLQKAYSKILRLSAHERYLQPEEIKDVFPDDMADSLDKLYDESASIVAELGQAIISKDDETIKRLIENWNTNNSKYFHICLNEYTKWIESRLKIKEKALA